MLTVGDEPDFAARGGMLGLVRAGDRTLAFEANPEQIQAAGVQLSAKVLKLARIRRGRRDMILRPSARIGSAIASAGWSR